MADPDAMDWSPIPPPPRTSRKRTADEMEEEQVDPVYGRDYMPGGWPSTAEHTTTDANYPDLPSTGPSYLNRAKRVCLRTADCVISITYSLIKLPRFPSWAHLPFSNPETGMKRIRDRYRAGQPNGRERGNRRSSLHTTPQRHTSALVEELSASAIVAVSIPEREPAMPSPPLPDFTIFKRACTQSPTNQLNESQNALSGELAPLSVQTPVRRQTREDLAMSNSVTLNTPFSDILEEQDSLPEGDILEAQDNLPQTGTDSRSPQVLSSPSANRVFTPSQQILSELMRATTDAEMEDAESYDEEPEDSIQEYIDSQAEYDTPHNVEPETLRSEVTEPEAASTVPYEIEAARPIPDITITASPGAFSTPPDVTRTPQHNLPDITELLNCTPDKSTIVASGLGSSEKSSLLSDYRSDISDPFESHIRTPDKSTLVANEHRSPQKASALPDSYIKSEPFEPRLRTPDKSTGVANGRWSPYKASPLSDISSTKPDTVETVKSMHVSPATLALSTTRLTATRMANISSIRSNFRERRTNTYLSPTANRFRRRKTPTTMDSDISSTKPDTTESNRYKHISPHGRAQASAGTPHSQHIDITDNLSTSGAGRSEPLTPFKDIVAATTPERGQPSATTKNTPSQLSQVPSTPVRSSSASKTIPNKSLQTPSTSVQHDTGSVLVEETSKLSLSGIVRVAEKVGEEAVDNEPAIPTPKSTPHAEDVGGRMTRQASAELKRQKDSKKYKIVALSEEWEEKVNKALKEGHGKYAANDLQRVVPGARSSGTADWLNDEVINGYLDLICKHGNKDNRAGRVPRYHAFNSFFINTLMDPKRGTTAVKRWSAKAKVGLKNLKDVEKFFIPINSGAHWTFLLVEPGVKTITYFNSMAGNGDRYRKHMFDWIRAELGVDFNEADWTFVSRGEGPQQSNMSDCGVFAVTTAKQIMLGQDVMGYGAADIPCQRRRIVAELIHGGLLPSEALER